MFRLDRVAGSGIGCEVLGVEVLYGLRLRSG